MVTAATTPFDPRTAVNDSSGCGNDYRQGGNVWSESFFLSLISVFKPSISYRGVLTGSSHCGPPSMCLYVCASSCKCEHTVFTRQTRGQSLQSCTPMWGSAGALFTPLPGLLSQPPQSGSSAAARLPASSARLTLQLLHAKTFSVFVPCRPHPQPHSWTQPQKHTLVRMQASLTMCGHTTFVDLFIRGLVAAAVVPNETTLFIVWCDSSGLTIRLIMSHWDIDGCLSILVFTKEPVPLLWVAVDTNTAC